MNTHNHLPTITIFSSDFRFLEYLWEFDFSHSEWKIEKAIKYKWNWKKFRMGYHLELRKLTEEEMESPLYKVHKGNVMAAMVDLMKEHAQIIRTFINRKQ